MLNRLAAIVAATTMLAGCGSTIFTQVTQPPGKTEQFFQACLKDNGFLLDKFSFAAVARRLQSGVVPTQDWTVEPAVWGANAYSVEAERNQLRSLNTQPGYVHLFLDCYIAKVAPLDFDGRLLRGHVVTALLAQYASASLIAKEKATKPSDAANIITHLRRAELLLISVSPEALVSLYNLEDPDIGTAKAGTDAVPRLQQLALSNLPNFRNAQRVAAVFDIGVDIARVDGRFVASTAGSLFDVVSGSVSGGVLNPGLVTKLNDLLTSAVAGLALAAETDWYGGAFIRDAQLSASLTPIDIARNTTSPPVGIAWIAWRARINAACASLKGVAGDQSLPCQPTALDLSNYIKSEYGSAHPYLKALQARAAIEVSK